MSQAQYAVIRYNPDPARGELLNVGILLWDHGRYEVRIEPAAVERVVRENPRLATDALLHLERDLGSQLAQLPEFAQEKGYAAIEKEMGFPIALTEPRMTTLSPDTPSAFEETMERLLDRVVRPKRRAGRNPSDPGSMLDSRLRQLTARGLVERNHYFERSRSGIERSARYFVNSGTNLAIDALNLNLKRTDQIIQRADAEAFKVEDIRAENAVRFMVFASFPESDDALEQEARVGKILGSVGAGLTSDLDCAASEIMQASRVRA